MKIATRVGNKASGNQRTANIGEPAARTGDDVARHTRDEPSPTVENAQQHQSLIQIGLIGQGDEIVSHLVQDRLTNREFGLELKDTMRQRNHRARHSTRLGRDRQAVPSRARQRKRAAHTR